MSQCIELIELHKHALKGGGKLHVVALLDGVVCPRADVLGVLASQWSSAVSNPGMTFCGVAAAAAACVVAAAACVAAAAAGTVMMLRGDQSLWIHVAPCRCCCRVGCFVSCRWYLLGEFACFLYQNSLCALCMSFKRCGVVCFCQCDQIGSNVSYGAV